MPICLLTEPAPFGLTQWGQASGSAALGVGPNHGKTMASIPCLRPQADANSRTLWDVC